MSGTTTSGPTDETSERSRRRGNGKPSGSRGRSRGPASRMPAPPRQRRPALAALAVLLIVGGALVAGLLAIRMDSRVSVIAASQSISPGDKIDEGDLRRVSVAAEDVKLIGWQYRGRIVGTYAKTTIYPGTLINTNQLDTQSPVGAGRSIVSVPLLSALTPKDLEKGDLVQVVRASNNSASSSAQTSGARDVTQGLVLSVTKGKNDGLGGAQSGAANLLVPAGEAKEVIDAANSSLAGLALISHGNSTDAIGGSR